jgi:hypothetical protein
VNEDDDFWATRGHASGYHRAPADAPTAAPAWCPDAELAPIADLFAAHRDHCAWCGVRARHAIAANPHTTALCAGIAIQTWAQWKGPDEEHVPGSELVWMCRQWWKDPTQDLDFLTAIAAEATVEQRRYIVAGVQGVIGTWQNRACPVDGCDYTAQVRIGVDDVIEPYSHKGKQITEPVDVPAADVFAAEHPHHRDRPRAASLSTFGYYWRGPLHRHTSILV